jgi:peptidoglycan/xylan/chitin deacetylase (PgdA/CDA1 family)
MFAGAMFSGVPILLYHRVGLHDGSAMDAYTVSPQRFREQAQALVAGCWNTVHLDELERPAVTAKRVAITFDDGFLSNREHAWPVLAELGLRSTTFVVTTLLGRDNAWDGAHMPRYPLLNEDDLRAADAALMRFESHSASHASLPQLGEQALIRELVESRLSLEALLGRRVESFAYPFGSWSPRVRDSVQRAGYRRACSCRIGRNNARTDPLLLRRIEIGEADHGWRLQLKLRTGVS